jgi:ssDNA-binding Zn-finger/Zn-ribbon topoisomerase 1
VPRPCPKCAAPYLLEKETKREGHIEYCNNPDCGYRAPIAAMPNAANE